MPDREVDYLLIGGGLASANCARWRREAGGTDSSILLVGREPDAPYNRPDCSKGYLRGEETREEPLFRPAAFWEEQQIELLTRTSVTALDLEKPPFEHPGMVTVAGDVTRLDFPDNAFDCIFCTEVLEHVPEVEKACREIMRVARHEVVIGVPFKQDIRLGRTTCGACGKVSPPWGHVNSFDEKRLLDLFAGLRLISKSFVGTDGDATNPLSTVLMDLAGNPWGTYDEDLHCLYCGASLCPPSAKRALGSRICSALAYGLNRAQALWEQPHGNWIHLVLSKI